MVDGIIGFLVGIIGFLVGFVIGVFVENWCTRRETEKK